MLKTNLVYRRKSELKAVSEKLHLQLNRMNILTVYSVQMTVIILSELMSHRVVNGIVLL
jgi:hypothetical protein